MPSNETSDDARCRILIVEDEALVAMTEEMYLTGAGYEVVGIADDIKSAAEIAARDGLALALVDMRLSHGDSGLDVAALLKARGVKSLLVTGNCPADKAQDLALGCLHKPFDEPTLLQAVEAARAVLAGKTPASVPRDMHLY